EKDYLPSAVRITLTFENGGREIEMPPLVVALMVVVRYPVAVYRQLGGAGHHLCHRHRNLAAGGPGGPDRKEGSI
ncbi:MAG: hypothetical protein P8Y85_05430, partial [Nitrospirota bacterium]